MSGPSVAYLLPTGRCNLSCAGCYATLDMFGRHTAAGELTVAEYCSRIDELVMLGVRTFDICGGEPLLYRPLPEIVRHAKRHAGVRVHLVTNGSLKNHGQKLRPLSGLIDRLVFSIDSPDPSIHDALRGQTGSFASILETIAALDRQQFPEIAVNQLLLRQTIAGLTDMLTLCRDHSVDRLQLLWPRDVSENDSMLDSLPSLADYRSAWLQVAGWLAVEPMPRTVEVVCPSFLFPEARAFRRGLPEDVRERMKFAFPLLMGLSPFRDSLVVKPFGHLTGDVALVNAEVFEGQPDAPLGDYWASFSAQWRTRLDERWSALRLQEPCANCSRSEVCRGGCPGAAHNQSGDWRARDLSCDAFRRAGVF